MSHRGYLGSKPGQHGFFFVPARFRDAWRATPGAKLIRELGSEDPDYDEVRPVLLARAKIKGISAGPSSVSPQESVDAGQPEEKATQRSNRKKGR